MIEDFSLDPLQIPAYNLTNIYNNYILNDYLEKHIRRFLTDYIVFSIKIHEIIYDPTEKTDFINDKNFSNYYDYIENKIIKYSKINYRYKNLKNRLNLIKNRLSKYKIKIDDTRFKEFDIKTWNDLYDISTRTYIRYGVSPKITKNLNKIKEKLHGSRFYKQSF